MITYNETTEFKKDFKKLLKKIPSLKSDLKIAKQYLIEIFHMNSIDKHGIVKIEFTGNNKDLQFYKLKKFACKSLQGRGVQSGIRIIYAFQPHELKIDFLEIYYKGNQENENRERIKEYLKTFSTL